MLWHGIQAWLVYLSHTVTLLSPRAYTCLLSSSSWHCVNKDLIYRISLNRCHPWIVAGACHPQIVAMQSRSLSEIMPPSKSSCRYYMWHMCIISGDCHRASARAGCVIQLVSMAESRTERLCLLLTASNSHHCIARSAIVDVCGLSKKINAALKL